MGTLADRIHANRILDEALGGESDSPIRFGLRDASEVSLGRITNDGYWDRRFRIRHEPTDTWHTVAEIIAGTFILGSLFMALWFFVAVAATVQP